MRNPNTTFHPHKRVSTSSHILGRSTNKCTLASTMQALVEGEQGTEKCPLKEEGASEEGTWEALLQFGSQMSTKAPWVGGLISRGALLGAGRTSESLSQRSPKYAHKGGSGTRAPSSFFLLSDHVRGFATPHTIRVTCCLSTGLK